MGAAIPDDDAVLSALGLGTAGWKRIYGRATSRGAPLALLAYQRDAAPPSIVVVEVHGAPPAADETARVVRHASVWLLARAFPDDPRLPGLAAVMAGPGEREVVRYRPQRRCTIRVRTGGETWFAKVLASSVGAAMNHDAVALWEAFAAGRLDFAVAEPGGFDAATSALWSRALPGVPVKPRVLSPEGLAIGERMGRALATLHASGVEPAGVAAPHAAIGRAYSAGDDLARRVPRLAGPVGAVLAEIDRRHREAPDRAKRPLHGAPHKGQWLADGDRLALVDFDRFGLGDPESDLAVLEAEMDYEERAPEGFNAHVRAGYAAAGGAIDADLLAAYRAGGHLAAARRLARATRPDAAERAARAAARAVGELEGDPHGLS